MTPPIKIAIAGLGAVGRETVRLLKKRRLQLRRRLGADLVLTAIADRQAAREARSLGIPSSVARYSDPSVMARTSGADIFVELLGGYAAPKRFVLEALGRGRPVVTANKRLLAYAWPQLMKASRRPGASLSFEGSVAGGVPVLRAVELSFSGDRILRLDGILNGTTNYILTRCEEGLSASAALREAQQKGFAEKDPSLDLSGQDSAQKLSVLAGLVAGGWLKPGSFPVAGIEAIEARDVAYAREHLGRVARLLASLRFSGSEDSPTVEAEVSPALIPTDHPLAAVRHQYNALLAEAASAGDLMFYGQGAGPGPTASAVLADVFMAAREILSGSASPRPEAKPLKPVSTDKTVSGFYLRLEVLDRPGALARIASALGRAGVSIASIHQDLASDAQAVPVMITTHPAERGRFERARRNILALDAVSKRHCAMRILS